MLKKKTLNTLIILHLLNILVLHLTVAFSKLGLRTLGFEPTIFQPQAQYSNLPQNNDEEDDGQDW